MNRSPLDRGNLRKKVRQGTPTYGTFIGGAATVIAEVCAAAGLDWLLLDLEHGAGGEEQVRDVVLAAGAYGVATLVRVETPERIRVGRVLDAGAAGIMFPRMESAQQVRAAIAHMKYQPVGDRGVATYNRACRFGLDPAALDAQGELLTVVQIESRAAVEAADEIAAIDDVDVLFIGPRDLSHDLGVPGQLSAPEFVAAVQRVAEAAKRHGKQIGTLVPNGNAAADCRQDGWNFLAIGSDTTLLAASIAAELQRAGQDN